jgi:MFS family permease
MINYGGAVSVLFLNKFLRMFSYGAITPVFFSYLLLLGIDILRAGVLMTLILLGDLLVTLNLTTRADSFGRRNVLIIGALLKFGAGVVFASTSNYALLVVAGIVGVISTSGGEIGPFLSVEQASVTDAVIHRIGEDRAKASIPILFGWYNAMGYLAQALGALAAGHLVGILQSSYNWDSLTAHQSIICLYATIGLLMALLYRFCLGDEIESVHSSIDDEQRTAPCDWRLLLPNLNLGLRRPESIFIVARLSCLFALDAFAGGFVMQTWIAYWFEQRWNFEPNLLGDLISVSNVVAGISGISAAYFVNKFGAINTMVWSHLPSNILLLLVPFMPSRKTAAVMLIARFCISQMDVPARQTYVAIVVLSDERSAAGGITNIARSMGLLLAPTFTGYLSQATPLSLQFNSPWVISGVLKCIYDLTLWSSYHFSSGLKDAERKNAQAAKAAAQFKDSSHKSSSEVTPLIVVK